MEQWSGKKYEPTRGEDGYDRGDAYSGFKGRIWFRVYYSDDEGKTWQGGQKPANHAPLVWAHAPARFIELDDGTLLLPVFGSLSDEDTSGRVDCSGVLRSKDGGENWGDFTLMAYDKANRDIAYNELDVEPMSDGTLVAAIRTEWRSGPSGHPWSTSFCFSEDQGRTWTKPELGYFGNVPDMARLPDGSVAVAAAGIPRVVLSYDGGHTWSREVPAHTPISGYTYAGVELIDNDHLFVFGRWLGRDACIYRRLPAAGE